MGFNFFKRKIFKGGKMNFKEFLRKNLNDLPIEYCQTECEQTYLDGKQDFAKALGEWALEECKEELYSWKDVGERFEEIKKFYFEEKYNDTSETDFDYAFKIGINSNLFSIAVACLGEKTVIEKLKELK